jgi:S1-C subfamily serine protease
MVITNGHVTRASTRVRVEYYRGASTAPSGAWAVVQWRSRTIDLAVVRLEEDPPTTARALSFETGDVVRGERIVLGGSPDDLPFQTTEGVVTGALPESPLAARCGDQRNCLVVDAASFAGSSGGPAINAAGHVVGMLWGGPVGEVSTRAGALPLWVQNPSFAFLIHVRTMERELRSYGESLREERARHGEGVATVGAASAP